ncbi:MAG: hypothetical protein V9E96_10200 [Chitinophagaceae bacterium]
MKKIAVFILLSIVLNNVTKAQSLLPNYTKWSNGLYRFYWSK